MVAAAAVRVELAKVRAAEVGAARGKAIRGGAVRGGAVAVLMAEASVEEEVAVEVAARAGLRPRAVVSVGRTSEAGGAIVEEPPAMPVVAPTPRVGLVSARVLRALAGAAVVGVRCETEWAVITWRDAKQSASCCSLGGGGFAPCCSTSPWPTRGVSTI